MLTGSWGLEWDPYGEPKCSYFLRKRNDSGNGEPKYQHFLWKAVILGCQGGLGQNGLILLGLRMGPLWGAQMPVFPLESSDSGVSRWAGEKLTQPFGA